MSVRRALVMAIAAGLACWSEASAGVAKDIGRAVGAGAVEKLQPALAATLADAEQSGIRLEDHFEVIGHKLVDDVNDKGKERIDQVDHVLEARLLQAKVEARDLTDHALSGVGELVNNSLVSARAAAKDVITDLRATTNEVLQKASASLQARIADIGREVNGAVDNADRALTERIAQADEALGRRLGNVDVIASKQRVAIEESAVRVAVLIGLVVFAVFVLRRLYARYSTLGAELDRRRGGARTLMLIRTLGASLLGHVVAAALGAGVLLVLYDRLPFGARGEAAELVRVHRAGFADSLDRFDFARARFHASQLEYLAPEDPLVHGALIAKAELLRDVFARPTLLGTEAGIASLWKRLEETRRLIGSRPDPDLLVVEAMLVWQTGESRRDELRAASLCARALRVRSLSGGFALAPLARVYVETFVDTPYTDDRVGLGRDSYALDDLRAVLDAPPALDPMHPLAARIRILRLMRTVDAGSSTAYAEMVEAHVELLAAVRRKASPEEQAAARHKRSDAANRVLGAWKAFDAELAAAPELARDPSVLQIFRLNDALYARAKWFVDDPRTDAVAPYLVASSSAPPKLPRAATATERLQLAPPRIVWARRYQPLLESPARPLFELQESNRFAVLEAAAYAFEQAMIDLGPVSEAIRAAAADAASRAARSRAAQAAAALGLYVSEPDAVTPRAPFARARRFAPPDDQDVQRAMLGRGIRLL